MKKPHLIIDVSLCQGCNNCFLACKDEHVGNDWPGYTGPQARGGERWIEIPVRERGRYPLIDITYRPTLCTQCSAAPCVARSGGAINKRPDGIVLIDPRKAAGRRDLVDACPYGMISWSEENKAAQKCTLCAHLLDAGWTKPRCVQACGPGALSLVWETDEEFAARAQTEGLETLHPGRVEHTAVCYKNLRRYDSCFIVGSVAVEQEGVVDCASGRVATLKRVVATGASAAAQEDGAEEEVLQTVRTDAFGDFKFDGLEPLSGEYLVEIAADGETTARMAVKLDDSVNLGTIMVRGEG